MIKLVIDPGHGGKDPGAAGNGLKEKDLNLDISKRVAYRLSFYEVDLTLTRTDDVDLSLDERCVIANKLQADYFCSIHTNAGGGTGFESYIYTNAARETENYRSVIHDMVADYLRKSGFVDRGKKRADFAVLRNTDMPAVLLENLFIDNPKDAKRLKSASFRNGLAYQIALGLVKALVIPKKSKEGKSVKTPVKVPAAVKPAQAKMFLAAKNPGAPDYVDIYVAMGARYGIRWDAVFAQSCKETAFWKFGGDVKPEQNNFAGLGTFDGKPGASFATPEEGIEAQFQHWHVYYCGGDLPPGTKNLDPRRDTVLKSGWAGTLQYIEDLGGRWAPSQDYGSSIVNHYLTPMLDIQVSEQNPSTPTPAPTQPPAPPWDPAGEIAKLKADGLIKNDHHPDDPVTWGEMATVINRLRGK